MSAKILDGKTLALAWRADIKVQVDALGVPLHLAAVCAGGDEGLRTFVKLKQKAAESIGMVFSSYFFDEHDEAGATQTLGFLAADDMVQGVLVELPLPKSWNKHALLSLIPMEKDVDLISPKGEKAFYKDESAILPPAVRALEYFLGEAAIAVKGKRGDALKRSGEGLHVAVVGAGALVGKPIAQWLALQGAHVAVVDIDTPNPKEITSAADMIISGTGKPGLITGDWIKEGATVIDFGFHNGKGDVDEVSAIKKAGLLTPVPGGMGPLVVAAVLENSLALALSSTK